VGLTSIDIILFYSFFLFFVIELSAMAGTTIVKGVSPPTVPPLPTWATGFTGLFYVVNNISYFFTLMTVSTPYKILGIVIFTPFTIILIWIIIRLIRGTGD